VFFISGAAGLLWTLWWMRSYFPPLQHPRISSTERADLASLVEASPGEKHSQHSWFQLFSFP